MSCAQVFELCKVCKKPSKMRIDFLGKVNIVDVVCDCQNKEQDRWLLWLNEEAENEGQASYGLEGCEEKRKRGRPKKRG